MRDGSVIGHDVRKMKDILKILNKPSEKRQDKDVAQLVPLLKELKFFKERRPMNADELLEIAYNGHYEFHEPGEVVYSQGDRGDRFYIVLRGKVQVSIPDPLGQGLVEAKVVVVEQEENPD